MIFGGENGGERGILSTNRLLSLPLRVTFMHSNPLNIL